MSVIEVSHLSYAYQTGGRSISVLNDVSFDIKSGEMVAIQGPSGSGKSTLLHLLGCMLRCQKGSLKIDGIDVSELSKDQMAFIRNRKLGFVFQQFHLLPKITALDNILLPTIYPTEIAAPSDADRQKAIELAEKIGLSHRLDHYPNELSGGEQQRVAIARALMQGANILLADEPTGNLDSKMTAQIMVLLKKLNQEDGITVILVTHEDNVAKEASKIIHFQDGKIQSTKVNHLVEQKAKPQQLKAINSFSFGFVKSIPNLLPIAFKNILRNKSRSVLTMLGIVIGVASIMMMVTLGLYAKHKIIRSYASLGINTIGFYAFPNSQLQAKDKVPVIYQSLSVENDIKPLAKIFPKIQMITPLLFGGWGVQLSYAGKNISSRVSVLGVNNHYLSISNRALLSGHNFYPYNIKHADSVCFVGSEVASQLFINQNPVGSIIHVGDQNTSFGCSVIGVLKRKPKPQAGIDPNLQLVLPYTFFEAVMPGFQSNIFNLLIKVKDTKDIQPIGNGIKNYFKSKYGASGMFMVDPDSLLLGQMSTFLNLFTLMLAAISIVSLIVGGIGIANMMLATISERLQEIGLRKALGATDSSTQYQFLLEAIIICCIAGVIGLVLGFVSYEAMLYFASKFMKKVEFAWILSPIAIALSVFSMIVVGIISGIIPSIKAKSIEIVTALRSE